MDQLRLARKSKNGTIIYLQNEMILNSWKFMYFSTPWREKREAALAAIEKREKDLDKYKGKGSSAKSRNNKTEQQLFREREERAAKANKSTEGITFGVTEKDGEVWKVLD